MKRIYLRIGFIVGLLIAIFALQLSLSHSEAALVFYIRHIFQPLQQARSFLFNNLPFSLGDTVYLLIALLALLLIIRTIYFLFTIRKNKNDFFVELLRLITLPTVVYFLFLVFWGGNYSRKPLSATWKQQASTWDSTALISITRTLVDKMNEEQKQTLKFPNLKKLNKQANEYYHQYFGNRVARLKVKPTSLGYMLNYLGIQGYYNPLSGEAQFNRFIPVFMHPFVVSHEMAHQAGIAAEDDANLLAYIIGAESKDPAFRYSSYFNLFVYAYSDLKAKDSVSAQNIFAALNQQSKNDLDTLRANNRRYRSSFRKFTTSLYDDYLRFHGQIDGIQTYSDVTRWVYYWEQSTKQKADLVVCP